MANRRGKMDAMTALSLAKQMRAQNREMGDPNLVRDDDPMRVLESYHRGFFVPPGTPEQQQRYKNAIDQRLYSQALRERRRAEEESVGITDAVRRRIADVVKPVSMAASLTPYDLGLGDLGYAAGELIDPEGTYGDAALAAGGGLLTAGLGSGAIMSKAAKEARALRRAEEQAAQARKMGVRAEDAYLPKEARAPRTVYTRDPLPSLQDDIPTVIKENPTLVKRVDAPYPKKGADFDDVTDPYGVSPLRDLGDDLIPVLGPKSVVIDPRTGQAIPARVRNMAGQMGDLYKGGRIVERPVDNPFALTGPKGKTKTGPGLAYSVAGTAGLMKAIYPSEEDFLMRKVRASSDYGNAFSETTQMNTPDRYDSSDDLSEVPFMLERAIQKAKRINDETGMIPIYMKREIGKLDALMNTKEAVDSADDRAVQAGLMDSMIDQEVQLKPSRPIEEFPESKVDRSLGSSGYREYPQGSFPMDPTPDEMRAMRPPEGPGRIEQNYEFKVPEDPSGIKQTYELRVPDGLFPLDPTPEQMSAMREIEPAMEEFGE
jgi:hypothetical protein